MKFSVERGQLLAAISAIHSIVTRKSTVPILANFMIEAKDGLVITATDMDMQASVSCPARVEAGGVTTLSAEKLYDIVRSLPEGAEISLDLPSTEHRADVKAGRSRFKVPVLPADAFPVMQSDAAVSAVSLDPKDLTRLLTLGGYCASTEESRGYLQCGYMHTIDGVLRVVSTDGKRLSYAERPDGGASLGAGAMLPPKLINAALRLLAEATETVSVEIGENKATMTIGSTKLIGKLLDGSAASFPDYRRVIPHDFAGELIIDTDLLVGAAKRALIMAEPRTGFGVTMTIADGVISLAAHNSEQGQASEEIEADWTGKDHAVRFNGPWFVDHLTRVRTENVIIKVSPGNGPMLICETGKGDWIGILMPHAG